jgi:hypothetical protein
LYFSLQVNIFYVKQKKKLFIFRERVHPGQSMFYRGDKHGHFLNAFVLTGFDGRIYYVAIAYGRNSDQLLFNRLGFSRFLSENDLTIFGDRGFRDPNVLTPVDPPSCVQEQHFNENSFTYRSVVENVNGRLGGWAVATSKFTQDVSLQTTALFVIYQLVAWDIILSPTRNWEMKKNKPINIKNLNLLNY